MAKASAGCRVRPTMPRMSYSRRTVGSKWWENAIGQVTLRSDVILQEGSHRFGHIRPLQGERDLGLQKSYLVAAVKATAFVTQTVKRLLADQPGHAVGQL